MSKMENTDRIFKVYEAMNQAVPDDNNRLEVMRAAEMIIANCIAQSGVDKDNEERIYKAIADDVKHMTASLKVLIEEKKEGEQ